MKENIILELECLKKDVELILKKIKTIQKKLGKCQSKMTSDKKVNNHSATGFTNEFCNYLRNVVGIKSTSIDDYLKDLKRLKALVYQFLNVKLDREIIQIDDLVYLKSIANKLYENDAFRQYNKKRHNHFSAPFNNYLKFLEYSNNSFVFED